MKIRGLAIFLLLAVGDLASANLYTVTNNQNAGDGSLRWAIRQANSHAGQDKLIFQPSLKGKAILLRSQLPALTDDWTTIDGDIDGDGAPDIGLNGRIAPGASGLVVHGDDCIIAGLAIRECYEHGILIENARRCKVRSCHIGLNLAGTQAKNNQDHQLVLRGAKECRIGGPTTASRNVISGGYQPDLPPDPVGILVENSANNTIAGNYIGVNRNGTAILGYGYCGIYLFALPQATAAGAADGVRAIECTGNTVGGTRRAGRNVIAGVVYGVMLAYARKNTVLGNTFGLGADGNTPLSMGYAGVQMLAESVGNTVGGTVTGARNVFGGVETGVFIAGPGTRSNGVRGNYFGTNVAGNRQETLRYGVLIAGPAEGQSVGGGTARAANYFALNSPLEMRGVWLEKGGAGTAVRHNKFGVRPNGTLSPAYDYGIHVDSVPIEVTDNDIVRAGVGILCENTPRPMRAFRNKIRRCGTGVDISPTGRCLLGTLGNPSAGDDGGNVFRSTGSWHIYNSSPWRVKAEGNSFGTTERSKIDAKIFDRRDDNSKGRVDFNPLIGGVAPTGTTGALAVSGANAVATPVGGAQITFTLSSDAEVSARVLNIAGRQIRTLCHGQDCGSGTNTLLWDAHSDSGLPVPNGTYLVELSAKAEDGAQARGLTQVRIGR